MSQTSSYVQPKDFRRLRACIRCKLLKTESQWLVERYCENCGDVNEENITSNFKGFISFTDPKNSWAAKWLMVGVDSFPGIYCISVDNYDEEVEEYEDDAVEVEENEY